MQPRPVSPGAGAWYYADGIGGAGFHFTAREKAICMDVYNNIKYISDNEYILDGDPSLPDGCTLPPGRWRRQPQVMEEFEKISGVSHNIIDKARKDIKTTGGYIKGPQKRGKQPLAPLEEELDNLEAFLLGLVEEAKKGGFLTVGNIREQIRAEYYVLVSRRRVRKALRRLGFRYAVRKGIWLSARDSYGVMQELWEFCCFVKDHVVQRADGTYAYVDGVAFVDESHIYTLAKRTKSWIKGADRFMQNAERAGTRINIIDGFISDKFTTATRVSWSSSATTGEYCGAYTTYDLMAKYFSERIFINMDAGQHLFVDNASVHKKFKDDITKLTEDELHDFIVEHQSDAEQVSFNERYAAEGVNEMNSTNTKLWYQKWIRTHDFRKRKLQELGNLYNVHVHFLPTGWFECDPVEKIFCHIKPKYRDINSANANPEWTWQMKLEAAYSKVDEKYVDGIVNKHIKWVLAKHAELSKSWQGPLPPKGKGKGKGGKGGFGMIVVGDTDVEESGRSSDRSSE